MQIERLSDDWLFRTHSKQTIKAWIRQLRYFYFIRASGGHANDGDEFQVAFAFANRQDLLNNIGLPGLKPIIAQSHTSDEFKNLRSEITPDTELEQPEPLTTSGCKPFIWVYGNSIHVRISGTKDNNFYEVTEDDFKLCMEFEKQFDNLGWQEKLDKSLEIDVRCIFLGKYPDFR